MGLLDVVKKVARAKVTRDVLKVLAGALAAYLAQGCGGLTTARHPSLDVFECKAAVLEPYVGDAARSVAAQISSGALDGGQLLHELGLTPAEVVDAARRFVACGQADAGDALVDEPTPEPNYPMQIQAD